MRMIRANRFARIALRIARATKFTKIITKNNCSKELFCNSFGQDGMALQEPSRSRCMVDTRCRVVAVSFARHWKEISNIVGFVLEPDPSLTLQKAWLRSSAQTQLSFA